MRTFAALVVVLGLMGAGVAVSNPPKTGKVKIKPQAVSAPAPTISVTDYSYPVGGPVTPSGWLVQTPVGGVFIPRNMALGTTVDASGAVNGLVWNDLDHGIPGSLTMHGSVPSGGTHPNAWIKVRVNGYSEAHTPYGNGFGTGPSTTTGNFSLSGGITVTAIP